MQRIRPVWCVLFALAPALTGCFRTSGDEPAFPKPISRSVCPELSGTFRYQADAESQGSWNEIVRAGNELGGPAAAVSLFDQMGSNRLTIVLHRDPQEFERSVKALRESQPNAYGAWRRQALAMFDPMRGALKVRRELPFDALTRQGPVPEWGMQAWKGTCVDGWYRDNRPSDGEIWMTRDVTGGLLVRFDKVERKVISLWAETGAGIPYAIHTTSRWARFAPVEAPAFWMPTPRNLPPVAEAATTSDPAGFLQRDDDARVSGLRSRARSLMGADATLLNFKEQGDQVLFTGTLPNRAALDGLLMALGKEPEVASVKLDSTMAMSFDRIRFVIHLQLKGKR